MKNPKKLHDEFVRLGGLRHKLKNKMLAILPEIYKSEIWKKYAGSIVEYAGKYGDIAKTTVIKRLRLEENLINLPHLKSVIEKVGVHKVSMLAKIATPETDLALAQDVLNMSKMAVLSLSKELRSVSAYSGEDDFANIRVNQVRPCKAVSVNKKIDLDEESTFLFIKLKTKLGEKLTDAEFLKLLLEEKVEREFPQKSFISNETVPLKSVTGDTLQESRYLPKSKKRATVAQTKGKCAYPNCNLPYRVLHHTNRYSESKSHESIVPLCNVHHEFAHNSLIQNETEKPEKWQMSLLKPPTMKISQADILYRKYRQKSALNY